MIIIILLNDLIYNKRTTDKTDGVPINNSKLYFAQSNEDTKNTQLIIGDLTYGQTGFSLTKKLKHLPFLNQFEEIILGNREENQRCLNVKVLLLDKRKIFFYLKLEETSSTLKVCSRSQMNVLACKNIDEKLNYTYRNVMTWGCRIVTLFRKPNDKLKNELSVYDDYLRLTCSPLCFDGNEVNLCSVNDKEIYCWLNMTKKCHVYSINNLDLLKCFGQEINPLEPFYFSNGVLLDARHDLMLFYFYDKDRFKQSIKIFNGLDGIECSHLNLEWNYFAKMFKIDSDRNVLVKFYEPYNLIQVFHGLDGVLIREVTNDEFFKFNRIDLTRNDEIVCFDKARNSIFIF